MPNNLQWPNLKTTGVAIGPKALWQMTVIVRYMASRHKKTAKSGVATSRLDNSNLRNTVNKVVTGLDVAKVRPC